MNNLTIALLLAALFSVNAFAIRLSPELQDEVASDQGVIQRIDYTASRFETLADHPEMAMERVYLSIQKVALTLPEAQAKKFNELVPQYFQNEYSKVVRYISLEMKRFGSDEKDLVEKGQVIDRAAVYKRCVSILDQGQSYVKESWNDFMRQFEASPLSLNIWWKTLSPAYGKIQRQGAAIEHSAVQRQCNFVANGLLIE